MPGVTRSNGTVNPAYDACYCFDNDFPALLPNDILSTKHSDGIAKISSSSEQFNFFQCSDAFGRCEVLCYHPRSDHTLALMPPAAVLNVIKEWGRIEKERAAQGYDWIQIFENRGEMVGCSNMHPHCQIWSCKFLPNIAMRKNKTQLQYYQEHNGANLLLDYVTQELQLDVRIVAQNKHWVCLVPFWAIWPYETMLIPKTHVRWLFELNDDQQKCLADLLQVLLIKYDNLFHTSFPYTMGWQAAPTCLSNMKNNDKQSSDVNGTQSMTEFAVAHDYGAHWQLHAVYYPPLLRSASVRKFMSGFELFSEPQRDLTPEKAAEILRNLSCIHYKHSKPDS